MTHCRGTPTPTRGLRLCRERWLLSWLAAAVGQELVDQVLEGRFYELEIFAGEGVAVDPASVTALTRPEVG